MTKNEYELAKIAYKAAIEFTDIDTDSTQEIFPQWFFEKTAIIINPDWYFYIRNDKDYETIN